MNAKDMSHRRPLAVAAHKVIERRSEWLFGKFRASAKRYISRHFHALRLSRNGPLPPIPRGPLVVVLNHPSWWDPLVGLLLSERLPERMHYAPMDARALAQYGFLERLGFFGIDLASGRGGLTFLRTSLGILERAGTAVWITAQGRFTDPRERPVAILPGVGHLAARLDGGSILPLALEYPFWEERTPEALARFGAPIPISGKATADEWTQRIAQALQETQDALAAEALRRDPGGFENLVTGRVGVGGVYDGWRRLRATFRGERFRPEHGDTTRDDR